MLETACRITHIPTGVTAYADQRKRRDSYKLAMATLKARIVDRERAAQAEAKKARRDHAIHNTPTLRTYSYTRGTVKDHRTGMVASIKDVVGKGRLKLLR